MKIHRQTIRWALVSACVACLSPFATIVRAAGVQGDLELEEVIVTAEKRETDLQKTPVAVNVVTAAQIAEAAITKVEDLQTLIPGVSIFANANSTGNGAGSGSRNDITIRGVSGATGGDPSTQPSAAQLMDGVYTQSGQAGAGSLFDLAQVEVLKGPQGTLYGRNATTGVINFITQKPKFDNDGQASIDFGSYGKTTASGIVNFALNQTVAVRIAAQSSKRNGYYEDGLSNEDTIGGRLKVLVQPNENVSLLITGNYSKDRSQQNGTTTFSAATGGVVGDPWAANLATGNDAANFYSLYFKGPTRNNRIYSISPQLDWNLGVATLTVIPAFTRSLTNEVGPTYTGTQNDSQEKSLETRLASNDSAARLKWLVGAFYYDQGITGTGVNLCSLQPNVLGSVTTSGRLGDYNLALAGPILNSSSPCGFGTPAGTTAIAATGRNNDQVNYSVFTQDTYSVVDNVRVTAGARWQYEKATRGPVTDVYYRGNAITGSALSGRVFGEKDWNVVTWKLGVDMDIGPQSLLYAMVATGWKAGTPLQYQAPYDEQKPEELTSFTVGSKNRFLDDRVQVNAEVFYWSFKNRQINVILNCVGGVQNTVFQTINGVATPVACLGFFNPPNGGVFIQGSAKQSHVQGVSADLMARATRWDTLTVAAEYLGQAIHDDMGGTAVNGCLVNCPAATAPKWSATFSWRHTLDAGDRGRYTLDARTRYQSSELLAIAATAPTQLQESNFLTSAGIGYSPVSNKWNVRAYMDNIGNELVKTQAAAPGAGQTTAQGSLLPPRTYGVQLRADF